MARKKTIRLLWKSPPLPEEIFEDEEWIWRLRQKAQELVLTDTPSTNDLRYALHRYSESTSSERDAMDAAFVWFTGYTLSSIVQMTRMNSNSSGR